MLLIKSCINFSSYNLQISRCIKLFFKICIVIFLKETLIWRTSWRYSSKVKLVHSSSWISFSKFSTKSLDCFWTFSWFFPFWTFLKFCRRCFALVYHHFWIFLIIWIIFLSSISLLSSTFLYLFSPKETETFCFFPLSSK